MAVRARVQSHPSRREIRKRLLAGLEGIPTEVIETDFEPPNPWLGYMACLSDLPDCTHLLVVQDDTITCRGLAAAVGKVAAAMPFNPVCLYLGGLPMRTRKHALAAGARGERFVQIQEGDFLPVVAVLWPVIQATAFMHWASSSPIRRKNGKEISERSDDAMGGRWMKLSRTACYATIPSLIEHPDDVPSTIARRPAGRTALFWHGPDWDASSVDWESK